MATIFLFLWCENYFKSESFAQSFEPVAQSREKDSFKTAKESSSHENRPLVNNTYTLGQVVNFTVNSSPSPTAPLSVHLHTANQFSLYAENLKFSLEVPGQLPFEVSYTAQPTARWVNDPFSGKKKQLFSDGTVFYFKSFVLKTKSPIRIVIRAQACSVAVCLLPASLSLDAVAGAQSQPITGDTLPAEEYVSPTAASADPMPPSAAKNALWDTESPSFLSQTLALLTAFLQAAFEKGHIFLLPGLFLAGFLANLTPCVYPMLPITVSVMTQWGQGVSALEKKRREFLFPLIYTGALVLTYSCLGVLAAMTGHLFGAQLSHPIFSLVIACLFFAFGLSMLGVFNLSFLQVWAHKIPISQKNPAWGVAIMGAVSGLVSAPCTGPILSMILLLIAQTKDPFSGFLYMLCFSVGFGFPYLLLGILIQKIKKLPQAPRVVLAVKFFFAICMFALSFYFLKAPLQALIGPSLPFSHHEPRPPQAADTIIWHHDYKQGAAQAAQEHKHLLVDVWASWCTACLEADKTLWTDPAVIKAIQEGYIAVKLDASRPSPANDALLNRWGVVGLPSVLLFKNDHTGRLAKNPILLQGIVTNSVFVKNLNTK